MPCKSAQNLAQTKCPWPWKPANDSFKQRVA
jgi:hypothetical protein